MGGLYHQKVRAERKKFAFGLFVYKSRRKAGTFKFSLKDGKLCTFVQKTYRKDRKTYEKRLIFVLSWFII